MDSRGFLSLQYLVRNDDGQICFVEYYCCPDAEVEEDWAVQGIPLYDSTLPLSGGHSLQRQKLPKEPVQPVRCTQDKKLDTKGINGGTTQ